MQFWTIFFSLYLEEGISFSSPHHYRELFPFFAWLRPYFVVEFGVKSSDKCGDGSEQAKKKPFYEIKHGDELKVGLAQLDFPLEKLPNVDEKDDDKLEKAVGAAFLPISMSFKLTDEVRTLLLSLRWHDMGTANVD
jgi:hypothetical protein